MIISIIAERTLAKFKAFHDKNTQQDKNKGNYLHNLKLYMKNLDDVAQWIECLPTKGSLVPFPVRAHAWVGGQVPSEGHTTGNHTMMFLSLSSSLPSPLKINFLNLKKKKRA